MKTLLKSVLIVALGLTMGQTLWAAATDGTATVTVTFTDPSGEYNARVDAFWVTDAAGNFIQNVRKDAGTRQRYLYKWTNMTHRYTAIDGFSGATIAASTATVSVPWDCKDTNNVTVPDGNYKFYIEFTDRNSQGPWTTNGLLFAKGTAAVTNTYTGQQYMSGLRVTYVPTIIPHDITLTSLHPGFGNPDSSVFITVAVTNQTALSDTFTVMLSNLTTASLIGSQPVSDMPGYSARDLTFVWDTAGLPLGPNLIQASVSPVTNETSVADNVLTSVITLREPTHDLAVAAITPPPETRPNSRTNVIVTVTNLGDLTESFAVVLSDETSGLILGTNQINDLPFFTAASTSFQWDTTNAALGYHMLRAVAGPVAGETAILDNTLAVPALVLATAETNVYIAKGSVWRFFDKGLDLGGTPWQAPEYYDATWSSSAAPLGYCTGNPRTHTNMNYVVAGGAADNRYPTYYFRREFYADVIPHALTLRIRRDDGAVVYLNGAEIARMNLPPGPIAYTNWALSSVEGTNQYFYYTTNALPTNLVLGRNVLAVELHQATSNSVDVVLDLELVGPIPPFERVHEVGTLAVHSATDVVAGDRMPVSVTLTNRGTVTETVLVVLQDSHTGQVIGSQTVTNLAPHSAISVPFLWATLGATNGAHTLRAYTVLGGVTNLAGVVTGSATISGSGFGLNAVNAAGSIGGRCAAAATTGSLLVVGAGATLEVWDRSTPTAPVKIGDVRLPGLIESVVVSGAWAYVACGNAGLQFVDLRVPARPLHRQSFSTSGHAYGAAVSGQYLLVADGIAGLRILNIANPLSPTLVGVYYTEGPARAVAVSGTTAYVLDQHMGLLTLNVAAPAAPTLLGSYAAFDAGLALSVSGTYAYITDNNNRFLVVNVAAPANPWRAGQLLLNGLVGQSLTANGTTVYLATGANGLVVVNASIPSAPYLATTIPTPGEAAAAAWGGSTLYVANGVAGFQVFDISSPTSPVLQSDYPTAVRGVDIRVTGQLAYVAAGEAGLRIYSVTNPTAPVLLSRVAETTNARCVAVSGTTAYVGDGQYGLKIVDLSNLAAPSLLGIYAPAELGSIRSVGVAGSLVVVSDGWNIHLVNVSTPANPTPQGTYAPTNFVHALTVADARAYLAGGSSGLIVLDMAPGAFAPLGGYLTPDPAIGVSVSGTKAYVAVGASGWLTLDISNPAAPSLVNASAAPGPVFDVAVSDLLATLGSGANLATTMDVSQPLTPVAKRSFAPLVHALRLAAHGPLAIAAEDEAGLALLSTSDDVDADGLPDAWEQPIVTASLATNGPIRTIADVQPGDDFDRDGASNAAEYIAGTAPTDPASVFMVSVQGSPDGATTTLRWYSQAGRTYTIYKSTTLNSDFVPFKENILASPPINTETFSVTNTAAFYLISVR